MLQKKQFKQIQFKSALDLEKPNTLYNLIKQQDDDDYSIIDKIHLYVKDPYEAKYQCLIKKRKKLVLSI